MANFRKTEATPNATTKGLLAVVTVLDKSKYTNEKTGNTAFWADVQVAQLIDAQGNRMNPHLEAQTQPHLHLDTANGLRNTGVKYSESQIAAMQAVATQNPGHNNISPRLDKDGNTIGYAMLVKADVMFPKDKDGKSLPAMLNTKTLEPANIALPAGFDIAAAQFDGVSVNREHKAVEKAAQEQAAQAQNPAPVAQGFQQPAAPAVGNPYAQQVPAFAGSNVPPAVANLQAQQNQGQQPGPDMNSPQF